MDINKDSLVDLNEFLEAFRLSQQSANQPSSVIKNSKLIEAPPVKVDEHPKESVDDEEEEEHSVKGYPQVDEYEISEMKEISSGGRMKKSPSIRSVVSVESLGQTAGQNEAIRSDGKLQNDGDIEIEDIISQVDEK
jgi:hypothetical protein